MEYGDYTTWNWGLVALFTASALLGLFKKPNDRPCRKSDGLFDYLFNDEE